MYAALIIVMFASQCTAFDITRTDFKVWRKLNFSEQVVLPTLDDCAWTWRKWGVTQERMRRYARAPRRHSDDDNDVFDCAWACFFLWMGWLDEDIEGSFQPPVMLAALEQYYPDALMPRARTFASRCVYVNYPHKALTGPMPDCGQAKLLKNCLIKEEVLEVTEKNKLQFVELVSDWLNVCAEVEGYDVADVLRRAQQPPPAPPSAPVLPALQGCVWRCLFYDMGWVDDVKGVLELSVVLETMKLYYREPDKLSLFLEMATQCVEAANALYEDADIPERPHGCDRSQLLVDCLVRDFFFKFDNASLARQSSSSRVSDLAREPRGRSGAPPAPRPRLHDPHPRPHDSHPHDPRPRPPDPHPHDPRPRLARLRLRMGGAPPDTLRSMSVKLRVDDGVRKRDLILNKKFRKKGIL